MAFTDATVACCSSSPALLLYLHISVPPLVPGPPSLRGGSNPKILGERALPPSVPSSPSPFSPFSETGKEYEKYELHVGLHLKSIISRVASYVMG